MEVAQRAAGAHRPAVGVWLALTMAVVALGAMPERVPAGTIPESSLKTCDGNVRSKWVKQAAKTGSGEGGLPELAMRPTKRARVADPNKDRVIWRDLVRCVGGLPAMTGPQQDSLLKQLYCHIKWARPPIRNALVWNLEAWRPNVDWSEAKKFSLCNWGGAPPAAPAPAPAPTTAGVATFEHRVQYTCLDGPCGLTVRSGPGYSAFAPIGSLADGSVVRIVCQGFGEIVGPSPSTGASSAVWDRLDSGGWVSDLYIDTPNVGQLSPPIPQC